MLQLILDFLLEAIKAIVGLLKEDPFVIETNGKKKKVVVPMIVVICAIKTIGAVAALWLMK